MQTLELIRVNQPLHLYGHVFVFAEFVLKKMMIINHLCLFLFPGSTDVSLPYIIITVIFSANALDHAQCPVAAVYRGPWTRYCVF